MTNFFKDNLKRLADKYTQKYIADKTGFSQSSINNYISKNSEPSIQFLVSLKDAFGIDLDDFLFSRYEDNEVTRQSITNKNNQYSKYLGAIVKYDKVGYGVGYIKSISGKYVTISFSNDGEPFVREFLVSALNNSIAIIKLEEF